MFFGIFLLQFTLILLKNKIKPYLYLDNLN